MNNLIFYWKKITPRSSVDVALWSKSENHCFCTLLHIKSIDQRKPSIHLCTNTELMWEFSACWLVLTVNFHFHVLYSYPSHSSMVWHLICPKFSCGIRQRPQTYSQTFKELSSMKWWNKSLGRADIAPRGPEIQIQSKTDYMRKQKTLEKPK